MLNKKIIITKHAEERFAERMRECTLPHKIKAFKKDSRKYLIDMLKPTNIKAIYRKPNGTTIVNTHGNYRFVIKEENNLAIVKTVMRTNKEKMNKKY